ncbi:MAG TPA: J domain-containing protein [Treponemataceae bacterium]|nr:J domain-containing protein [Treponemataceae bacterium]
MQDYYKILGVSPKASASEIKRAFRAKVKTLHPDLSSSAQDTEQFNLLMTAYELLSDVHQRSIFDTSFAAFNRYTTTRHSDHSFNYREWLAQRTDEESRCKLVIFDLMHHREDDAVKEFKKLNTESVTFSLSKWFTREDFMDYGFILAEELVLRQEYYDAVMLLEQIITMEYSCAYFKHFFPEVLIFTKDILRRRIAGYIPDELAIDAFERALDLRFGKKDDAYFLLKMAECYIRLGDAHTAQICLSEAKKMDSTLHIPKFLKSFLESA